MCQPRERELYCEQCMVHTEEIYIKYVLYVSLIVLIIVRLNDNDNF